MIVNTMAACRIWLMDLLWICSHCQWSGEHFICC